jgi:hypothetical protein
MAEHGPFETEDQAREIPAVRAVYDAYDHGRGPGDLSGAPLILTACVAAGVDLGAYDRHIIAWLGNWSPQTSAVIAGLIIRAHEAGKTAATEGAETRWGVVRPAGGSGSDEVHNCGVGGEAFARQLLTEHRRIYGNVGSLSTCQVTPWKEVPDA